MAALRSRSDVEVDSGVLISQIYEGDPADKGGIRVGDVVTAVDGKPVESSRELSAMIAGLPVAVTMAGGYAPNIEDIVDIHFQTVQIAAEFHRSYN